MVRSLTFGFLGSGVLSSELLAVGFESDAEVIFPLCIPLDRIVEESETTSAPIFELVST